LAGHETYTNLSEHDRLAHCTTGSRPDALWSGLAVSAWPAPAPGATPRCRG
jgi:hypothetical protein